MLLEVLTLWPTLYIYFVFVLPSHLNSDFDEITKALESTHKQ